MTITTNPARNEYTANAGQTVFNYTFKIFENTDLNVYVTPAGQECTDADLTTAYIVDSGTIGNPAGGFITLNTPTGQGDLVTIALNVPSSRTADYQNNGDFRPETVNNDFDRVVSIVKKVEGRVDRTLQFQECEQNSKNLTLPKPESGKILVWNAQETGMENLDIPTTPVLTEPEEVNLYTDFLFNSIQDMKDGITVGGEVVNLTVGSVAKTLGYYSKGDQGGATYSIVAGGTGIDDGGSIIDLNNGQQAKLVDIPTPEIFGAIGNGITDDYTSLQNLLNVYSNLVLNPQRIYSIQTGLSTAGSKQTIDLNGAILRAGSDNITLITIQNAHSEVTIKGRGRLDGFTHIGCNGILIDGTSQYSCKRNKINDIQITNMALNGTSGGTGIVFYGVEDLQITNNSIYGLGASAIQNTENGVTNPYGSRRITVTDNIIYDLDSGESGVKAHGISINSWAFVSEVVISGNTLFQNSTNGVGNGIEIWAAETVITGNVIQDFAIGISCGVCFRLVIADNKMDVITPSDTGPGGIGIEIGGCFAFSVSGNVVSGYRRGLTMSAANIQAGNVRFAFDATLDTQHTTISSSDFKKLRVYSTYESGGQGGNDFDGSYYGTITNNTILSSRNYGIEVEGELTYTHSINVLNNLISGVGVFGTPPSTPAGIEATGLKVNISGNSIDNAPYGITSSFAKCTLGVNSFKNISVDCLFGLGGGHKFHITSMQSVDPDTTPTRELILTRTQGTYDVGDIQYNHLPAASSFIGEVCTQGGTYSTLTGVTATGTSGNNFFVWGGSQGNMVIDQYINIAGSALTYRITDIDRITDPLNPVISISPSLDISPAGAAVSYIAPVFKTFGAISA